MHRRGDVLFLLGRRLAHDHERSVEALLHAVGGVLMRVVPEGPDLLRAEAVDVAPARRHRVLGHARNAVLGVRDVDAVPVDRHAVVDVLVDEGDLEELPALHADLGAGRAAVERPRVDLLPRGEADPRLLRGQRDADVRLPRRRDLRVGDAEVHVLGGRAAAAVDDAVVHDVVARGQPALPPLPAEEAEKGEARQHDDGRPDRDESVLHTSASCWCGSKPERPTPTSRRAPGRSSSARSRSAQASSEIRSGSSVPTERLVERLRMAKSG